jgi:hypothetical protein
MHPLWAVAAVVVGGASGFCVRDVLALPDRTMRVRMTWVLIALIPVVGPLLYAPSALPFACGSQRHYSRRTRPIGYDRSRRSGQGSEHLLRRHAVRR